MPSGLFLRMTGGLNRLSTMPSKRLCSSAQIYALFSCIISCIECTRNSFKNSKIGIISWNRKKNGETSHDVKIIKETCRLKYTYDLRDFLLFYNIEKNNYSFNSKAKKYEVKSLLTYLSYAQKFSKKYWSSRLNCTSVTVPLTAWELRSLIISLKCTCQWRGFWSERILTAFSIHNAKTCIRQRFSFRSRISCAFCEERRLEDLEEIGCAGRTYQIRAGEGQGRAERWERNLNTLVHSLTKMLRKRGKLIRGCKMQADANANFLQSLSL